MLKQKIKTCSQFSFAKKNLEFQLQKLVEQEPFQCEEVKIQNIDKFFPAYRTRRFYNGGHFSVLGDKDLILLCNPIQGSSLDVQKELGKRTFFLEIIGGQISPLRKIELIVTNLYPEDESQNKPDKISNKCSKKNFQIGHIVQ